MKKKWDELTALLEKEHSITGLCIALSLLTCGCGRMIHRAFDVPDPQKDRLLGEL